MINIKVAHDAITEHPMPEQFVDCSFQNAVWYVLAGGSLTRLLWNKVKLARGETLADAKHSNLLHAAKTFLLLAAATPVGSKGRDLRGSSLAALFKSLRQFINWMSERSLYDFSRLTLEHLNAYRAYIESRRVIDHRHRGRRVKSRRKKRLARHTLFGKIQVLLYLVRLQNAMGETGTCLNLYEVEDLFAEISGSARSDNKTERVPDDLFRRTISAALQLLEHGAPMIASLGSYLESFERSWQIKEKELSKRPPVQNEQARYSHHFVRWRNSQKDAPTLTLDGKNMIDLGQTHLRDIRNLIAVIRGAALTVLAGLVGMRVSELRTLLIGCLRTRPLPDGRSLLTVHGTLYKTSEDAKGEDAEWVAGWDEPQNPVRLAIETLEALARLEPTDALFPASQESRSEMQDKYISIGYMGSLVRSFAAFAEVDNEWHFEMHQFRKTFARFVALSAHNAPLALMRHFKHVSIQMTERYFPDDAELVGEIIEASEQLIAERLDRVFGSEMLGGIKGQQIVASNIAYRGDAHADERRELVQISIGDPTVRILLHVYGMCIYDEATARCKGDIANVGIWTCIDCSNSVVDEPAKPFWTEELARLDDAIALREQLGFIDLDLIRQREKALNVLESLKHGNRQTA